jgi:hypothetical protein
VKPPVYSNSNHAVSPIRARGAFSADNHWRSKRSREKGGTFKATRPKLLRGAGSLNNKRSDLKAKMAG